MRYRLKFETPDFAETRANHLGKDVIDKGEIPSRKSSQLLLFIKAV